MNAHWRTNLLNWQGVLIRGDYRSVHTVALDAARLIPLLDAPSEVAVLSLRTCVADREWASLQIEVNGTRRAKTRIPSDEVVAAFDYLDYQSGPGAAARALLARDPHVALAVSASRLVRNALFVHRFDDDCASGYLNFVDGRIDRGKIYGWGGRDLLWSFAGDTFDSRAFELGTEEFDYRQPAADGFVEYVGTGADDLFLSAIPINAFCWRFQLMTNRELVPEVRSTREVDDRYFTAAAVEPSSGFPTS
jgi:hypothetical protein